MEVSDIEPALMVQKEEMEGLACRMDMLEEHNVQLEIHIRRLVEQNKKMLVLFEKVEAIDRILLKAVSE